MVHAISVPLRGSLVSDIFDPLQRGHRSCAGKVVALQSPHWLPISWGFSSGQVEILGSIAFCIEGSSVSRRRNNALTKPYNSIPQKRKPHSHRRSGH